MTPRRFSMMIFAMLLTLISAASQGLSESDTQHRKRLLANDFHRDSENADRVAHKKLLQSIARSLVECQGEDVECALDYYRQADYVLYKVADECKTLKNGKRISFYIDSDCEENKIREATSLKNMGDSCICNQQYGSNLEYEEDMEEMRNEVGEADQPIDNEEYHNTNRQHNINQQYTIINGEWDTQGRHYTPAGDGNRLRQDGTFMQKAAGGYIDTKTGQFVPSN